jgi:hypothetical protein
MDGVSVEQIQAALEPLRKSLLEHALYQKIGSPAALRTFMEQHVFAVWDFMSLLKALQRRLSCVSIPWVPNDDAAGARFINEIVLGEESDEDGHGGFASHFELYHRAMIKFGARADRIDRLISLLRQGHALPRSLEVAEVGQPIREFITHTFAVIESGDLVRMASTFTFGREDLLPDVFQKIVDQLDRETAGGLAEFKHYLLRHVELDGGEHGPMATRLVADLCGDDPAKWNIARGAAVAAPQARLDLWDAIDGRLEQVA